VRHVQELGYDCEREFIRRIFKAWRWSWKKPAYKQIQKYTPENIERYNAYGAWILEQDLKKIKFMDEVHFVSKDCSRNSAVGPIGENVILLRNEHFAETYSASCLCSLENQEDPVFISLRKETNSQLDFLTYIVQCIQAKHLKSGDTLVLDNASIHSGSESFEALILLLQICDIRIEYLPPYSPEYNPCENIFAQVKNYLRHYRDIELPLSIEIATAFSLISHENVSKYYNNSTNIHDRSMKKQ